jgi:hypothetical protein
VTDIDDDVEMYQILQQIEQIPNFNARYVYSFKEEKQHTLATYVCFMGGDILLETLLNKYGTELLQNSRDFTPIRAILYGLLRYAHLAEHESEHQKKRIRLYHLVMKHIPASINWLQQESTPLGDILQCLIHSTRNSFYVEIFQLMVASGAMVHPLPFPKDSPMDVEWQGYLHFPELLSWPADLKLLCQSYLHQPIFDLFVPGSTYCKRTYRQKLPMLKILCSSQDPVKKRYRLYCSNKTFFFGHLLKR